MEHEQWADPESDGFDPADDAGRLAGDKQPVRGRRRRRDQHHCGFERQQPQNRAGKQVVVAGVGENKNEPQRDVRNRTQPHQSQRVVTGGRVDDEIRRKATSPQCSRKQRAGKRVADQP